MIRLFLWLCTLVGFIAISIVIAFYTQSVWLASLISNRIHPFGLEFKAQEIQWLPAWPLRVEARQVVISYLDGEEPKDLLRGSEISIEMETLPWTEGAWQIHRVEAKLDEICWAPYRVKSRKENISSSESTESRSSRGDKRNEANHFSLLEYQFQLTRLIVYPSKHGLPPSTWLLNLKTPVVRGPFNDWNELQRGIFPVSVSPNTP